MLEERDGAFMIRFARVAMQPRVQPGTGRQHRQEQDQHNSARREDAVQERNDGGWWKIRAFHQTIDQNG